MAYPLGVLIELVNKRTENTFKAPVSVIHIMEEVCQGYQNALTLKGKGILFCLSLNVCL